MNFRTKVPIRNMDINLTPLVDVVLQLVLFFMVTTQFAVLPGLKLTLPTVDREAKVHLLKSERLEITLTASGEVFFETEPITLKLLPYHLERSGASGDEVVMVITADREVPYGRVIEVMDSLRQNNFQRVVFAARNPRPEESENEK